MRRSGPPRLRLSLRSRFHQRAPVPPRRRGLLPIRALDAVPQSAQAEDHIEWRGPISRPCGSRRHKPYRSTLMSFTEGPTRIGEKRTRFMSVLGPPSVGRRRIEIENGKVRTFRSTLITPPHLLARG